MTVNKVRERRIGALLVVNRPFIVTPKGTRLCRPSEVVFDLLEHWPAGHFCKEDGALMIDANVHRVGQGSRA